MSVPIPFATHPIPSPTRGPLQPPGTGDAADTLGDSRHLLSPCHPLMQPLLRARDLQEAAVLSNIRTRFERQLIYVSLGTHSIPPKTVAVGFLGGSSPSERSQPQTSLSRRPTSAASWCR